MAAILTFFTAFLLGSIPWGLIVSKGLFHRDLREVGSGNIGTTNAIRALGKAGGYLVFVLDFAKGILSGLSAYWYAGMFDGSDAKLCLALAFLGSIWGHAFTPWLKFKGGKGIAVGVGCMFVSYGPAIALIEIAIFAVLVVATRHVSVGSLAAAIGSILFAFWAFWGSSAAIAACAIAGATIVWAHRGNIERLRNGTESRVGKDKGGKTR